MIIWDEKSKFYNFEDLLTVKQEIVDSRFVSYALHIAFFFANGSSTMTLVHDLSPP